MALEYSDHTSQLGLKKKDSNKIILSKQVPNWDEECDITDRDSELQMNMEEQISPKPIKIPF